MACFCSNTIANFIFSLSIFNIVSAFKFQISISTMKSWPKCSRKIFMSSNRIRKFIFRQEYAFAERCCFLTFSLEGNFRKYDISVKRKHTKTKEKWSFLYFSKIFVRWKFFFSCSVRSRTCEYQEVKYVNWKFGIFSCCLRFEIPRFALLPGI